MKRIVIPFFALLLSTLFVGQVGALQPRIELHYGGKWLAPEPERVGETTDSSDWVFKTEDGKIAIETHVWQAPGYPVYRLTSRITNLSETEDSEIVKDLRIFANQLSLPKESPVVTIRSMIGSICAPEDYSPKDEPLPKGREATYSTPSGRSSSEVSPFIEAIANEEHGWLFGIGWTGCWRAKFKNTGDDLAVELGMLRCNFKLRPGESLLQPSILFAERHNMARREFKTLIHRYMRDFNSPRDSEGKICEPIVALTAGGGNKTPQMMLDTLNYGLKNEIPFDVFWVDAGWYGEPHEVEPYSNCGPMWYRYAGQWIVNTKTHPTGDLLPIANAIHAAGKRFLLWFEPERINPETPLAKTPPFDKQRGMCYFGDPESLAYMEKTIFDIIEKHHVDIYRQDFNMEPTGAWGAMETDEGADRVGVYEAKHVEGLYKFLDDMREKFPWIMQENCAGGGRRIDPEMVKRAHSYCRSDYFIGPKPGDTCFNLGQNMTLNLTPYLPFQGGETNCVANFDDYGFMSVASSGTVFTPTDLDGGIVKREFSEKETAWFKKMMGWAYRLKPYYMGDFYPLTDETTASDAQWCAWSCHRPEENDGFVILFRRCKCERSAFEVELPAIDPSAKYEVEYYNGNKKVVDGKELAKLVVKLETSRSFFLAVYKKI